MSPTETSKREGLLEHPDDALAYFEHAKVASVVLEEKHMGSRAVVVVARDEDAAHNRFGVADGRIGRIYTRTGRPFFSDDAFERALLERLIGALSAIQFWDKLHTGWVCIDAELMPWSAKAQALIAEQYQPVGVAAVAATQAAADVVSQALGRGLDAGEFLDRLNTRAANAAAYVAAYEHYSWPVVRLDDLRLAPFHILATEGAVHTDRPHMWHMQTLAEMCGADPTLLVATPHRLITVSDAAEREAAVAWWTELTNRGGEGIVIKPADFVAKGPRGLLQPALKCRGREYLRIIYGPDYTMPEHIERLRERGIGRKRAFALREFALGVEGLQRFVRGEPLRRVHECAFGVLALESEPVDPRL
jgi:protein phosphatase